MVLYGRPGGRSRDEGSGYESARGCQMQVTSRGLEIEWRCWAQVAALKKGRDEGGVEHSGGSGGSVKPGGRS
jgi:hypothetical protein